MNKKEIIVILAIIIVCILAVLSVFFMVNGNSNIEYENVSIADGYQISLPVSNSSSNSTVDGVFKYKDSEHNLNLTSYSGEDSDYKDKVLSGSEKDNGFYYNKDSGVYTAYYYDENTNETVIISCDNLDILKTVSDSLKFTKINEENSTSTDDNTDVDTGDSGDSSSSSDSGTSSSDSSSDSGSSSSSSSSSTSSSSSSGHKSSSSSSSSNKGSQGSSESDDANFS